MYSYWASHFLNLSMCANIYSIFIDFHFYWQWHQHIIVIGWYWLIPIDPDVDISMMWPCSQKHQRVTHVPWTSIFMTLEKLWLLKIYADINVVPQCRQTAITKQFNKATVLNRGPSSWWETSIIIMVAFMLGNYIQVFMDVWKFCETQKIAKKSWLALNRHLVDDIWSLAGTKDTFLWMQMLKYQRFATVLPFPKLVITGRRGDHWSGWQRGLLRKNGPPTYTILSWNLAFYVLFDRFSWSFQQKPSCFRRAFNQSQLAWTESFQWKSAGFQRKSFCVSRAFNETAPATPEVM